MKQKKTRRPAQAVQRATPRWQTGDSFQNLKSRLGYGAGSQQDGAGFGFDFISRNRTQLEAAYQSNWMCSVAVDLKAEDMTREGMDIYSTLDPDGIEQIHNEWDGLELWDRLCDTIKWSRLYGGALAVMLIDGQKMDTPLRLDAIGKGQFRGLMVLDRWLVQPTLQDLVTEYSPDLGMPKYYDVVADSMALQRQRIHHSRVIRIDGQDLPYWRKLSENLWGVSVLEKVWDRIVAFDSATEGAAQLIYKAHLRTYKVADLRAIIGAGGPAFEGLLKQIDMIRQFQSNEGLTLMDATDEFETHSYSFAGLSDMIIQFGQQLSGAVQIPMVRLFGQSPAGLNSTGESDLKTYYDDVSRQQNRKLRSGVMKLVDIVCRSALGKELPEGTTIKFRPLYQMSAQEKATVAQSITDAVGKVFDAGIIDRDTALKELRQSAETTGVFSNISDEDITEAESDPPPGSESLIEVGNDPNARQEKDPAAGEDQQG